MYKELKKLTVSQCVSSDWCKGYNTAAEEANKIIDKLEYDLGFAQIDVKAIRDDMGEKIDNLKIEVENYKKTVDLIPDLVYQAGKGKITSLAEIIKRRLLPNICGDRISYIQAEYELNKIVKEMIEEE